MAWIQSQGFPSPQRETEFGGQTDPPQHTQRILRGRFASATATTCPIGQVL